MIVEFGCKKEGESLASFVGDGEKSSKTKTGARLALCARMLS